MAESMQGLHRTCRCAEVTTEMVGKEVTLMGWVAKARNKGGLVFVDLRDRSGIMQLIFENGSIDADGFAKAGKLRSEFVIAERDLLTAFDNASWVIPLASMSWR